MERKFGILPLFAADKDLIELSVQKFHSECFLIYGNFLDRDWIIRWKSVGDHVFNRATETGAIAKS